MTAGGGAWDNAKNMLSKSGGRGQSHKAVTGDTVGDLIKILQDPKPNDKITNIVALLLLVIAG